MTLTQSPSVSATPGRTMKITCTMSGGSIGGYYTSWYMQKPGGAPVFVWYGSSTRGSGIPDRFTGSTVSSHNQMHLTITNVQWQDAADYYCGVADDSTFIFTFSSSFPRKPAVSVLRPSAEEIRGQGTATLVCLVSGFNPAVVNTEWTVDGSTRRNGVETSRIQQDADNTFSASSYLTLPASDWNSHELYSCVVKHESQATPFQTNIA
ncbi:immunoglobulin lambda-1 light chain-like [Hypanus sabinus]|uniref:immunoglobulin lambda-1 light chain-like n=1 Tax=Hypanus sabinus TaxID=79690 RepID=UPI0028C3E7F6|nr:immunoglobulin lambda-1 light chain-like [Hypanus sabinus]